MRRLQWLMVLTLTMIATINCSSLFYFPDKRELVYRHKLPLQPQDVTFASEDGTKLHGWFFGPMKAAEPRAVIVQFHGNGQNLTTHFLSLYEAPGHDLAYLAFDYRGYGQSEGSPEPKGVIKDGIAAIRWMHDKYPDKPLIVFAQSLGGAIAIKAVTQLKNEIPISLFIVDSSFYDYRAAAATMFKQSLLTYLLHPLAWAIVDNEESPIDDIPKISPIPLIVVHGNKDRILNESLGRKLFDLAKEPKEFWLIPGGQHTDFMFREDGRYGDIVYERIDKIVREYTVPVPLKAQNQSQRQPSSIEPPVKAESRRDNWRR